MRWSPEDIAAEMRLLWLVEQVRTRRLGTGKAAELSELSHARFFRELGAHGVPVFDLDPSEFDREFGAR